MNPLTLQFLWKQIWNRSLLRWISWKRLWTHRIQGRTDFVLHVFQTSAYIFRQTGFSQRCQGRLQDIRDINKVGKVWRNTISDPCVEILDETSLSALIVAIPNIDSGRSCQGSRDSWRWRQRPTTAVHLATDRQLARLKRWKQRMNGKVQNDASSTALWL